MAIDWMKVGESAALVLAGAGAAVGVIRRFFATWAAGKAASKPAPPPLPLPVDDKLLPAVLSALESARDAAEEAVQAVRSTSLTAVESQRSLASIIGALRGNVEQLAQEVARLKRANNTRDRTAEHRRPPGAEG